MEKYCLVYSTFPDEREAFRISEQALKEKLAACANIVPHIYSIYRWQSKVERSSEVLVIMKTTKKLLGRLAAVVKEMHSYKVPEIIALPIIYGHKSYLEWIGGSVLKSNR